MHCGCPSHNTSPNLQVPAKSSVFKFRHFDLAHGMCAQKMGTDSMLLGAWAQPPPETQTMLDVGTGTGAQLAKVDSVCCCQHTGLAAQGCERPMLLKVSVQPPPETHSILDVGTGTGAELAAHVSTIRRRAAHGH